MPTTKSQFFTTVARNYFASFEDKRNKIYYRIVTEKYCLI